MGCAASSRPAPQPSEVGEAKPLADTRGEPNTPPHAQVEGKGTPMHAALPGEKQLPVITADRTFGCSYPMYTMDVADFLKLDTMKPHEDLLEEGLVHKWESSLGACIFLSHQWTSNAHPDPTGTQLRAVQAVLGAIIRGEMDTLFRDKREWQAFAYTNAPFSTKVFVEGSPELLTVEGMAEEVKTAQVWLDYTCVPQRPENLTNRLLAIDSIPSYIDCSTNFFAVVPPVPHSDLPGVLCDYNNWQSRGWCRLDEQVQELSVAPLEHAHLHRRPLVILADNLVSSIDSHDNFYLHWQQRTSVFNGDFSCCRLNHEVTSTVNGVEVKTCIPCDKERIRPMVARMWDRKIKHEASMPLDVVGVVLWRWISHKSIMLADTREDDGSHEDQTLNSLEDICSKYFLLKEGMDGFIKNQHWQLLQHDEFTVLFFPPIADVWMEEYKKQMQKWRDLVTNEPDKALVGVALQCAVGEGNVKMVRLLHQEHGADLHQPFPWGMTLLQYAANKGHVRVAKYILENGGLKHIDDKTPRQGICAFDRACKAGHVEFLRLLVEYGASYLNVSRHDGETPAHGAAMFGHTAVLRELHALGCNLCVKSEAGETPRMAAERCQQHTAAKYLASVEVEQ
ncbi:hypothetical protein AB1Y20_009610 [Prymnesium parvum]|uniref:Uncharacterized protein n=1 Tax=Prymnesium parvum TaxID=97485 RepID=A0AB34K4X7_PRYPA